MSDATSQAGTAAPFGDESAPPIGLHGLLWSALAVAVMIAAIVSEIPWFLNFVHVMAGILWTGIDLFMGFVVGPILKVVSLDTRRAIISRLMPRMLFLMPTLAIVTGTSGWYLAKLLGFLDLAYPQFWWVVAALTIIVLLTIQGIGVLLPTNLRVYFELRKPHPDGGRIGGWMRKYVIVTALQGTMQIAMIVIMARFVTGL
ncbi:MAG: hypothetical protein JWL84_2737 [Rhodospirillales bacterium]|nr:hypothetical protein [Rhodospirillales bacterium]